MKYALSCLFLISHLATAQALKEVTRFDLPGPAGKRFDYLTIDYDHNRLFSAHLGAGLMYVIDLNTNQVLNTISDLPGIEGIEYIPELNKAYTSDWKEQKIAVIDLNTMKILTKLPAEAKPDGSTYASDFHKLYVTDEVAKAEIIIDVNTDQVIKTLRFDSETGMPQYDPITRKVYLNLQDVNKIAVIDPATDEVVETWDVGQCEGNHGMAVDSEGHRLFLACEGNNLLTVFDLRNKAPIAYVPIAAGSDVVKYDPVLKRTYVACYSGAISVIAESSPNQFVKLEDHPVAAKVHSLAVDLRTHKVYAPEQEENGNAVSRMIVYDAL